MENKQLYASVKASFVAKHSSLHKWCLARGIHRQNARAALLGDWTGGKATELRTLLIAEAGIEVDGPVDTVELAHETGGVRKGAVKRSKGKAEELHLTKPGERQ